ncbi:MAG: hypothetical protein ABII19_00350 [Patescibacteria group bacterium]
MSDGVGFNPRAELVVVAIFGFFGAVSFFGKFRVQFAFNVWQEKITAHTAFVECPRNALLLACCHCKSSFLAD